MRLSRMGSIDTAEAILPVSGESLTSFVTASLKNRAVKLRKYEAKESASSTDFTDVSGGVFGIGANMQMTLPIFRTPTHCSDCAVAC